MALGELVAHLGLGKASLLIGPLYDIIRSIIVGQCGSY